MNQGDSAPRGAPRGLIRLLPLILLAVLAIGLRANPAQAHATLESTSPAEGAVVEPQPTVVSFRFDEPVEGPFAAVRVLDRNGHSVGTGGAFHPGGRGDTFSVRLRPGLADGSYTASYRVISADGHIIVGGFVFAIGKPSATTVPLATLTASGSNSGGLPMAVARAAQFGAIGVAAGALLFSLLCWLPALAGLGLGRAREASRPFLVRIRWLMVGASVLGLLASIAGVALEGAAAADVSAWSGLRPSVVDQVLETRFGVTWAAACVAWALVGIAALLVIGRERISSRLLRTALLLPFTPMIYLLLLPSASGHGSTQTPIFVLFPTTVAHVVAMSAWFGGLVALVVATPPAYRVLSEPRRTQLTSAVLERFSFVALASVIVIVVSGLTQSFIEIRHPPLLISSAFGRATLVKVGLLLVLVAFGARNRRHLLPRLRVAVATHEPAAGTLRALRRTLRAEITAIVVVLGVTGLLTGYPPASAQASGPVTRVIDSGSLRFSLLVDPARLGNNEVRISIADRASGRPFDGTKQLTVAASLPSKSLGPLPLSVESIGLGVYAVTGAYLNVPGEWTIAITDRTSAFDETVATTKVRIR